MIDMKFHSFRNLLLREIDHKTFYLYPFLISRYTWSTMQEQENLAAMLLLNMNMNEICIVSIYYLYENFNLAQISLIL